MIGLTDIAGTVAGIVLGMIAIGIAEMACDLLFRKGKR